MEAQYTLPGVMHYLRTEWQQRERARIEWEIERADLRSRLNRLEMENHQLQGQRDSLQRHLDILVSQLRHNKTSGDETKETGSVDADKAEEESTEVTRDKNSTITAEDTLHTSVVESRDYLSNCLADIKFVLQQCGVSSETDMRLPSQVFAELPQFTTLANFGRDAAALAALRENRIVCGTNSGDLLLWEQGAAGPRKFGENKHAVKHLQYIPEHNELYVATGSEVQLYDVQFYPQLVGAVDLLTKNPGLSGTGTKIAHFSVSPQRDALAAVLSDGSSQVYGISDDQNASQTPGQDASSGDESTKDSQNSTPGGFELEKRADSLVNCRSCGFAELDDRLHLVLTRNASASAGGSSVASEHGASDDVESGANLLMADPLTGRLLKKIVIAVSRSITAMLLTPETIVIGTDNGDLRVLGMARGDTLAEVPAAHCAPVTSLNTLNDGKTLISTGLDGRASLWSLPSLVWKGRLISHDGAFGALSSAANEREVAVGGGDGIIRVYSLEAPHKDTISV